MSGADAGGCHCYQRSTPKWLTLISRVEFSFLKMLWKRFSNLSESSCGRHCSKALTSVGGYNFSCCPVFNTIRNSVQCTKYASLFSYNYKFSERLDAASSETMAFRMVEIGYWNVFQARTKNNRKGNFQHIFQTSYQHSCTTAAGMLQVSKVVALTS